MSTRKRDRQIIHINNMLFGGALLSAGISAQCLEAQTCNSEVVATVNVPDGACSAGLGPTYATNNAANADLEDDRLITVESRQTFFMNYDYSNCINGYTYCAAYGYMCYEYDQYGICVFGMDVCDVYGYRCTQYASSPDSCTSFHLRVQDLTDPANPVLLADVETPQPLSDGEIIVINNTLIGVSGGNLLFWSIDDPANPTLANTLNVNGFVEQLYKDKDMLYVKTAGPNALTVIDPANPAFLQIRPVINDNPAELSVGQPVNGIIPVLKKADFGFETPTSISLLDANDLLDIQVLGEINETAPVPLMSSPMLTASALVYRDPDPSGRRLRVYDFSNPATPIRRADYQIPLGTPTEIDSSGRFVYFTSFDTTSNQLGAIDFANPQQPSIAFQGIQLPSNFGNFSFEGNLLAFNSSAETSIVRIGTCALPFITLQPSAQLAGPGDPPIQLAVEAIDGDTFQWFQDGVMLTDGGPFAGATTSTLTAAATNAAIGIYTCRVSNDLGSVQSTPAILGLRPGASCPADQNFDGILNGADFNSWLQNFAAGCP